MTMADLQDADPIPTDPADLDSWGTAEAETSETVNPIVHRDISFYIDPVTFQVGNTLFRVSKTGFQVPGTIFEAMFSLPSSHGSATSVEGSSDDNPIHLYGVDVKKFRAFLAVLYPSLNPTAEKHDYSTLIGALDISTFWEFTKLRKEIIATLSPMVNTRNPLEVIYIATKYRVADWLRKSYTKLVYATPNLLMDDLSLKQFPLDWATIAKIYYLRDIIVRGGTTNVTCSMCNKSYGPSYQEPNRFSCECRVIKLIDAHFQIELDATGEGLSDLLDPPLPGTATPLGGKMKKNGKKTKK